MKGINIKDRDFILYNTPPKVGKSLISYIDQIDYLIKANKNLNNAINRIEKSVAFAYKEDEYSGAIYDIENIINELKEEKLIEPIIIRKDDE